LGGKRDGFWRHQDTNATFAFVASRSESVQFNCQISLKKDENEGLKLGLGYIHSHGIVDNDLSFQNFIIFDERAVIIDLGSAEPEYIYQYG